MATITSANAVFKLGIQNLYNTPVTIDGFAVDDAFMVSEVDMAETLMGVDGKLSAGFTPYIVPFEFSIMADSNAGPIMDALIAAEKITKEKYVLNATIMLPSIGLIYAFTTGYLKNGSLMPAAKKVLQSRKFSIDVQDMTPAPL